VIVIEPGKVYQLSPLTRRITAPNPGKMTGAGTNTYLVGHQQVAVIDPGPDIDSHVAAILEAGAGNIRWVVVTHTHPDHSPAARAIIEATGAEPIGCVMDPDDGHQDISFQVAKNVAHGELLASPEFTLEAIFTPGHVGNHFCYLLREENLVFAGDHLMEGISVVIIPPSGDLKDFIDSLERLKGYPIDTIAPAHGHLIKEPQAEIDGLIRHRQYREDKVLAALQQAGPASLQELVGYAYDDVEQERHKIAVYSLWAHLLKLERQGRAKRTVKNHWAFGEEHWALVVS
jgi:glyoxylase-like metal-dependent hydrolase (beta-lactamase superfamily II)